MSGFKALRDVSNRFENDLRQVNNDLFSAQIGHKFEDNIEKKLNDLALFSSKLKLLDAKTLSSTPQVLERTNEATLEEYGDTAVWKVLEQVTAKSVTQAHAVTALIKAPAGSLDAEMAERREAILDCLTRFGQAECQLRKLNSGSLEAESEASASREQWSRAVAEMRDCGERRESGGDTGGPLHDKLSKIVDRLELMRWLMGRLVCARGPYDWLADPHRRIAALALTRQHNTVELFTD